jgi:hypothetical protein
MAKDAPKPKSRFTDSDSKRNSEIQSLAIKHYRDDDDWLECVGRATKEVDNAKD